MKKFVPLCGLILLFAAGLPASAQTSAKEAEKVQKREDYEKAFGDRTKHKLLEPFLGTFEGTLKTWNHGTPPVEGFMKQTITSEWKWETFLVSEVTTQFGKSDKELYPMVFNELIYRGHNPGTQLFTISRFVQGDPREFPSTGTYDEKTRTFTFEGTEKDPVTGDSFVKKDVVKIVDNDRYDLTIYYRFQDGSEIKAVEGVFKRKK